MVFAYFSAFVGESTFGASFPNRKISRIMFQNAGLNRFRFCANTAERPSEPHSTSFVESAKDMSLFSLRTPSSENRPTRWG